MATTSVVILYNHVEKGIPQEQLHFSVKYGALTHECQLQKQQYSSRIRTAGLFSYYDNDLWNKVY